MPDLPYANATSGKNALNDIQRVLKGFGAQSFGAMEDFETGDLVVQFRYRDRDVVVRASAKGYAAAWLRANPHTNRMRSTLKQHQDKALEQGRVAVYSILRDWLKGQITAVETGMLTFEGAFLGQLLLPSGKTVLEQAGESGLIMIEDKS